MANTLKAEISRLDLKDLKTPASATITEIQHLASYNWIEASRSTPTVAVPGSPDLWSPPNSPFQVPQDSGRVYIAQNAARHPDSPLEPLFRSLYATQPTFDIASIDVVTDRNNVRKLLGFVNPRWNGSKKEAFTIHVEITQNTAIFCREETKTMRYIAPYEFKGYGHSFEKKCTIRRVNGSTGHHRIISYDFGGLKFIVRHETDGYVNVDTAAMAKSSATPHKGSSSNCKAPEVDDLSSILDSLKLSPQNSEKSDLRPAASKLVIREEGQAIPLTSTLEIKTRVSRKPLAFSAVVCQLWVSQTPKLVRAYHTKGVFAVPKVEDVTVQVKAWEDENQKDLKMVASLIRRIRDVVKDGGGRAVLKYDVDGDKLVLKPLEGKKMLPNDLYAKWEGGEELGAVKT
jgi:hypothetical protein